MMEFLLGVSLVANAFLFYLIYKAEAEIARKEKYIRKLRKELGYEKYAD